MLDHCTYDPTRCNDRHPCNPNTRCMKDAGHAGDHANGTDVWGPPTPADAEAAFAPSDPRYPGDMSDPRDSGDPGVPPFACLGCGITYDDIHRFKIADRTFDVQVYGSAMALPLCSVCAKSAVTLVKVIATEIRRSTDASDGRRVAALFACRDKLIEDKVLDVFAQRTDAVNGVLNRQQGAIDECRAALGLDTSDTQQARAKNNRSLFGMVSGAIIGYLATLAPDPMVYVETMVSHIREMIGINSSTPTSDPDDDPRLKYAA